MGKCGVGVCNEVAVDKGFCEKHQPTEFPAEKIQIMPSIAHAEAFYRGEGHTDEPGPQDV